MTIIVFYKDAGSFNGTNIARYDDVIMLTDDEMNLTLTFTYSAIDPDKQISLPKERISHYQVI